VDGTFQYIVKHSSAWLSTAAVKLYSSQTVKCSNADITVFHHADSGNINNYTEDIHTVYM